MRFHKTGPINSWEDWFQNAPPKQGLAHWKDWRSAKELARAWFPQAGLPQFPAELRHLLDSRPETAGFEAEEGTPELVSAFDSIEAGEKSNLDLVLTGRCGALRTMIGIEAKADESFGSGTLAERLAAAEPPSRVPERIKNLCQVLFGKSMEESPELRPLMYQLLTGVAGTLAEAQRRGAAQAVFVVHQFQSDRLDAKKIAANNQAFGDFLRALSLHSTGEVPCGQLFGPRLVTGNEVRISSKIPLFVGKCQRVLSP